MKTNFYLQFILTVIAINLSIITLRGLEIIPSAHAETAPEPPISTEVIDVNIVSINGMKPYGSNLPISIRDIETSDELPIIVKGWKTSDLVPVDLKKCSTYDKVPVEVKNNYVYIKNY